MKKIIDLQTFQKITTDCMRVHETVRSTEPLTAEAERILQLADSLLREAGLAYLNEGQNLDVPSLPNGEQATPPEQVVENFIGVQHALADLKQALCQLVKTHAAEQRWPELATSFNALRSLGESGSDVSIVVNAIEAAFIQATTKQVAEQRWPELATSCTALRSLGKDGPKVSRIMKAIEAPFIRLMETQVAEQRWPELEASFNALVSLGEEGADVSSVVMNAIEDPFIHLVQPQVAEQRWSELATTFFNALISLGGNGSESSNKVKAAMKVAIETAVDSTIIPQAEALFESKEWDKGRRLLRSWLSNMKLATDNKLLKTWLFGPKLRSCYYTSTFGPK